MNSPSQALRHHRSVGSTSASRSSSAVLPTPASPESSTSRPCPSTGLVGVSAERRELRAALEQHSVHVDSIVRLFVRPVTCTDDRGLSDGLRHSVAAGGRRAAGGGRALTGNLRIVKGTQIEPHPDSRWSLWSRGSLLSIGSTNSALSAFSVGSFASIGSVGSFASVGSIGSSFSVGGVLSSLSVGSVLSHHSTGGRVEAEQRRPAGLLALAIAVVAAGIVVAVRARR